MLLTNKGKWYLRWWAIVGYFLLAMFVIGAFSSNDQPITPTPIATQTNVMVPASPVDSAPPPAQDNLYQVVKVIDGDTITVEKAGKTETLRLIGINTPETVDPRKSVECFGKEASAKAKELLSGKQVKLEADPTQGELDKYQRVLRYVFLLDGTNFNKLMIEQGYAYEYTYNTPYKYQIEFKQAQQAAETAKRGLWADGVCDVTPVLPVKNVVEPVATPPSQTGQWICSRNTYNCSDFKTQAEAQSAFASCGGTSNDVHQLDRDKDGQVCESLP